MSTIEQVMSVVHQNQWLFVILAFATFAFGSAQYISREPLIKWSKKVLRVFASSKFRFQKLNLVGFLSLPHLFEGKFGAFGQTTPSSATNPYEPDTSWPGRID